VDEHATSEHIAIEDMVAACQIIVALVTQEPDGGDDV
jgi:tripeptide aminopeptidase